MNSKSSFESGSVEVEIDKEVNIDYFRFEVANMIRQIQPSFPERVSYPVISLNGEENDLDEAIMVFSLYGKDTKDQISRYARDFLLPELSLVEGFSKLELVGNENIEWVVEYDPEKMMARNISVNDIRLSFAKFSENTPLSTVLTNDALLPVVLSGSKEGASLYEVQINKDSLIVPLKEVANIRIDFQNTNTLYRINGQSNIRIRCIAEVGANQLAIATAMKKKLDEISKGLPESYQILLEYDQTEFLIKELNRIKTRSLLSLGMILLFVLIVYRNLKKLLIILISLAVNLGLACIAYNVFDVGINLYALAAITISFGIMVDNALIMVHHLKYYNDLSVFKSLVSATLTTIASLAVIFFLPPLWQENLSGFSDVIIINLSVSLLVSLFFVSALLHRFNQIAGKEEALIFKGRIQGIWNQIYQIINRFRRWIIMGSILLFGIPIFLLPTKTKNIEWYNKTIGSELYQEKIRPIVDRALGGTFRLFHRYVYENGGFRNNEETYLYANARLPDGSKLSQTEDVAKIFEDFLIQYHPKKVKNFFLNVSGERISFRIAINDDGDFTFPFILKNELTAMAVNMGGAKWNIYGVGRGFSNGSGSSPPQFRIKMKGYNLTTLRQLAGEFATQLQTNPRVNDMDTEANMEWYVKERMTYHLEYDTRLLAEQNISLPEIQNAYHGFNPRRSILGYTDDNTRVSIIAKDANFKSIWNVRNEDIPILDKYISLENASNYTRKEAPQSLFKEDQQYIQLIQWVYTGSSRFGAQHLERIKEQFEREMPLGYTFEEVGSFYFGQQSKQQYGLLFLVVILIYMITAIHFESLRLPFSIILFIPLSYIGIFMTFYYFDFSFDQGGFTSFLLVGGITVNSMIILLNDYVLLKKKGFSSVEAYVKAFLGKITPIILTVLSTIVGLIPFLLFGDKEPFWFALAAGSIGGLLFSIFALVFIMPAYVLRKD